MEEKKFAIYQFYFAWDQDDYKNNCTEFYKMYKEDPTEDELKQYIEDTKKYYEEKHIKEDRPIIKWLESGYKYIEHESWVGGWFNHMTYNQFETDEEIERSFWSFINRKKIQNLKNGHDEIERNNNENKNPFYCFMDAEDRYRWKICRCEHCVAQGKITIDH